MWPTHILLIFLLDGVKLKFLGRKGFGRRAILGVPPWDSLQKVLSRETGISGNFVGRIKGAKCPFDLQFLTWDFS